jgi:8-oxo-dGTP pyrophosphatase MutT (NUDIX family)
MDLKQAIQNYNSITDQEIKDKEMFLKYINTFDDVVTRNNQIVHFTSSAFIVNKTKTKVLMIYHNIYKSWCWVGGHADGDTDLMSVAIKETGEETGLKSVNVLDKNIYAIDTLPVLGHVKKGKYIPAHVHLSVAYLFEADEKDKITIKPDENSNICWIDINKVAQMSSEEYMKPLYTKIIQKLLTSNL